MARDSRAVVLHSSAVLTGVDGKLRYFRGQAEVPAELRRQMDRALHGGLTAMIVLADEGGQAYLHDHPQQSEAIGAGAEKSLATPRPTVAGWNVELLRWLVLECVAAGSLALLLYFFATGH